MDHNIEEYLNSRHSKGRVLSEDIVVDYYYERRVSEYRSSTVMVRKSWGTTLVTCRGEYHYEEFV